MITLEEVELAEEVELRASEMSVEFEPVGFTSVELEPEVEFEEPEAEAKEMVAAGKALNGKVELSGQDLMKGAAKE